MLARGPLLIVIALTSASVSADTPTTATAPVATAPATRPVEIPSAVIAKITDLYKQPSRKMTRAELFKLLIQRMETVLETGFQAEKDYPGAPNLHELLAKMLPAADFLAKQRRGANSQKQLLGIAARLLESDAPPSSKAPADYFVTLAQIDQLSGDSKPQKAAELIKQMADRYRGTSGEASGLIYATLAAEQAKLSNLKQTLLEKLQSTHADSPGVRPFLSRHGQSPSTGALFEAQLKRLDGTTLTLPDDLKGKVVLIDFWASWCGPCVASLPKLKEIYSKYRDQGLEIVGISLDRTLAAAKSFIRDRNLGWIHTYGGSGRNSIAAKYGVNAIPSLWLIGRDGKVITNNARGRLDTLIPQALKTPAPNKTH